MPDMDVIERARAPRPVGLRVVDLEFDVRGHPTGLDWAHIGPDDLRGGVFPVSWLSTYIYIRVPSEDMDGPGAYLLCHIHRPDAGACTNV